MSPRTAKSKGGADAAAPPSATAEYPGLLIEYWERDKDRKVKRHYDINGVTVPSVSTVKDILDAPPTWWGMQVGVDGMIQLFNTGFLFPVEVMTVNGVHKVLGLRDPMGQIVTAGMENAVALLQQQALTTKDKKDAGATRGQSVHDAFKLFCDHGEIPNVMDYPPQEQGYIEAMLTFLEHAQPEPVASEVIVGSAEHGFAGRYDVRFRLTEERQLVAHHTPVHGPQWVTVPPGEILGDVKTSKYVYATHPIQLGGYELGSIECGLGETSARAIIQFEADGQYRFVRCDEWAPNECFLTVLGLYNMLEDMKTRKPPGGRH